MFHGCSTGPRIDERGAMAISISVEKNKSIVGPWNINECFTVRNYFKCCFTKLFHAENVGLTCAALSQGVRLDDELCIATKGDGRWSLLDSRRWRGFRVT